MIPPRVWGCYARYVYEQAQRSGHRVYNRRAFEDAAAVDGMRRLEALAVSWWQTFILTPERLAQALVDGSAPRYVERRQ